MDHPAKGCTKRQIEVFEQIAAGNDCGHHSMTLKALESKGLIIGRDGILSGWPSVNVRRYHVPLPAHAQWCAWVSKQAS